MAGADVGAGVDRAALLLSPRSMAALDREISQQMKEDFEDEEEDGAGDSAMAELLRGGVVVAADYDGHDSPAARTHGNDDQSEVEATPLSAGAVSPPLPSSASGGDDAAAVVDPEALFESLEEIGRGGYGTVWRARRRSDDVLVACKRIPVGSSKDLVSKVAAEIRMLNLCAGSRHVVACLGTYLARKEVWIVLEYMEVGSLRHVMDVLERPLVEAEVSRAAGHVLLGLRVLHSHRMIHRDVKADNLLLNAAGVCKLADFGTAATYDTQNKRNTACGTFYWVPPELINEQDQDERCDVWSLGITCIELAEGKPPFFDMLPLRAAMMITRETAPLPYFQAADQFSSPFQAFVRRCVVRDPAKRPFVPQLMTDPFVQPLKAGPGQPADAAPTVVDVGCDCTPSDEMVDAADDVLRTMAAKCLAAAQVRRASDTAHETAQQRRLLEMLQQLDLEHSGSSAPSPPSRSGQSNGTKAAAATGPRDAAAAKSRRDEEDAGDEFGDWDMLDQNSGAGKLSAAAAGQQALRASEGFVLLESPLTSPLPGDWPKQPPVTMRQLIEMLRHPVHGIDVQDRSYRLRAFPSCFVGSAFVDWCMKQPALALAQRTDAVIIGQTLMFRGVIEHVVRQHAFADKGLFYQFTEDARARAHQLRREQQQLQRQPQQQSRSPAGGAINPTNSLADGGSVPGPAPLSSLSLATDPAGLRVERLISRMREPKTGVKVKTRKVFLHRFHKSFAGSEIVSWLLFQRLGLRSRRAACEMLQLLMARGAFYPLTHGNRNVFKDNATSLYRFYLDDPAYFPEACREFLSSYEGGEGGPASSSSASAPSSSATTSPSSTSSSSLLTARRNQSPISNFIIDIDLN